jgi:hypothetical protein
LIVMGKKKPKGNSGPGHFSALRNGGLRNPIVPRLGTDLAGSDPVPDLRDTGHDQRADPLATTPGGERTPDEIEIPVDGGANAGSS